MNRATQADKNRAAATVLCGQARVLFYLLLLPKPNMRRLFVWPFFLTGDAGACLQGCCRAG
jgi:hypothetical protein